ncbi:MAG: hypothetical protein KDC35_00930 [Acidobacteria bacterium]|nr:hypothetical protein [Acidobacteriota bacterium]
MLQLAIVVFGFWSPGGDVDKWLEKLADVYRKAPLTLDLNADMSVNQMGMQMDMTMSGTMSLKDQTHHRTSMSVSMRMPENAQQQGMPSSMDMAIVTVFDGTTMWVETDIPAMGMKQVMKMGLDQIDEVAKSQGFGNMGISGGSLDPGKMVEMMTEMLDLQVASVADGKVTLSGELKEEAKQKMAQTGMNMGLFTIVMDEENIFPMTFGMAIDEKPFISIAYTNAKFMDTLDENLFKYEPPPGVPVQDMGAMMGQSQ